MAQGITYNFWLTLGIKLLGAIIRAVSPHLREAIEKLIKDLYQQAKKTDNPADDFFVSIIAALLGIKVED